MKKIALTTMIIASLTLMVGCGAANVQTNPIKPGNPPEGMNYDGVWFSNWGRLEMTQQGDEVEGIYDGERKRGKIEGEIDGDLLRFHWTEWDLNLQGKPRETSGLGVFQYQLVQEGPNLKHHIEGTWGYGESDIGGGKWSAVKSGKAKKMLKPFDPAAAAAEAERQAAPNFEEEEEEDDEDEESYDEEEEEPSDSDFDL